jgi:tetratricopeptide (TPR) repeat protein
LSSDEQADPRSADAEYRLGLSYMQLHRWAEAYRAFAQAVAIDPTYVKARIQVAELDLASNRLQDAQQQVDAILKIDKNDVGGLILKGRMAVQNKKYQDAQQEFLRASELAPHDAKVLNYLAGTDAFLTKYDGGEQIYQQAIALDPAFYVSYLNLATLYRGEGKADQEINTLLSGIKQNPAVIPLYLALADSYATHGNWDRVPPLLVELRNNTKNSSAVSLAIAQFYFGHGKLQEAKDVLSDLLSREKSNIEARKALIEVELELRQTADAGKLNQELLKEYPHDPDANLYQGRLLLIENKPAEAITVLEQLSHDVPERALAHYTLGLAYGQHGEVDREIASVKQSLLRDPNLIKAYMLLAQVYVERGDGKLALSYANEALKRSPRLLLAQLIRTNAELMLGDPQTAERELSALAVANPNNAAIQERLGYAQLMQRKFAEASTRFEEALQLQPDFVPALRDLYALYQAQSKPQQAITRIQQQIQRAPQQGAFYEILGDLYQSQGNLARASDAYKGAIAHGAGTNASLAYARLAQVSAGQQNYPQAIENAKTSIAQNPDLLPAYIIEGVAYEKTGQFDQAKRAYQDALGRSPNFAPALNNLAWLECEHGGNLDEALSLAQHAKQLLPDDPNISDTLGWIEYRKSLYGPALPLASDAATRSPDQGQFQYHLGMILLKAGNRASARQALERALKLQLTTADAEDARRALGERD